MTKRDASMLPFNNLIVKVELSGKTLRAMLEHGVARSGVGETESREDFPQISGMSFKFDVSKPAGSRAVEALGQRQNRSRIRRPTPLRTQTSSSFARRRRLHDVQGRQTADESRNGAEGFGSFSKR
ncbi:MAG: 5'-nucleotidase C-terminal domain-containing protein [Acidobacteria bacterium]|nr:5'-nucleotidase C-terminal domain-containing protein [Acidobacteriota bacterium]